MSFQNLLAIESVMTVRYLASEMFYYVDGYIIGKLFVRITAIVECSFNIYIGQLEKEILEELATAIKFIRGDFF